MIIYAGHARKTGEWLFQSGKPFPYIRLLKCLETTAKKAKGIIF